MTYWYVPSFGYSGPTGHNWYCHTCHVSTCGPADRSMAAHMGWCPELPPKGGK